VAAEGWSRCPFPISRPEFGTVGGLGYERMPAGTARFSGPSYKIRASINPRESPDSLTPEHALAGIVELEYEAPVVPGAYRSGKVDEDVVSAQVAMLQHELERPKALCRTTGICSCIINNPG
jgi:hypothetical protein